MISAKSKGSNMTVKEAAQLMGVSEQFIRIGLQRSILPFGWAIKLTGKKYTYYISPKKFEECTGIKIEKTTDLNKGIMKMDERLYLFTDDTLDVGKEPLEVTEEDIKFRGRLKERIKNGEFNKEGDIE